MKKQTKSRAEREKLALNLVDGIEDQYLTEAISLHTEVVDSMKKAATPKLFWRKLSIAACIIIALAIIPVAVMIAKEFNKHSGVIDTPYPDHEYIDTPYPDHEYNDVVSVGESVSTFYGDLTYLSFEDNCATFLVKFNDSNEVGYLLTDGDSCGYYTTNYISVDVLGTCISDGVIVTYGESDTDGFVKVTLNLSPFINETGLDILDLNLSLFSFGRIELNP